MASGPTLERRHQRGGKSSEERSICRRWQRYRLNLPIRIIVQRDDGTRITEGRASDICEGGLLVFAGMELRSGEKVLIEFTPPYSSAPVRAPGVDGVNSIKTFSPLRSSIPANTRRQIGRAHV